MSSASVKRILAEVRELSALNTSSDAFFTASPLESDLFEWHFTVRGPPDTPFAGGLYHGRILLPPEYPLKAPEILLLTPNGRFEVGTRICLSVTSHHNETWQPSWGVRTILTALVGFMPSKSEGLGALDYLPEERRSLARKSHAFVCERCGAKPAEEFPAGSGSVGSVGAAATAVIAGTASSTHISVLGAEDGSTDGRHADTEVLSADISSTEAAAPSPASTREEERSEPAAAVVAAVSSPVSGAPAAAVRQRSSTGRNHAPPSEEKELLYLACALAVLIVGIILRRVVNVIM